MNIKIGNQIFNLEHSVWIFYIKRFDLYYATYDNKIPLFFISKEFKKELDVNNSIHPDGLLRSEEFKEFLENHKIVLKNCYYDIEKVC